MAFLPEPESFRRIVDGTAQGAGATLTRIALAGFSLPYGLAIAARNAAYDRGVFPTRSAPIPVISVGNLTLGGTGKTPLVAWVVRRLHDQRRRPAIVSRGYAARPGERSDEAAELQILVPGAAHVMDRDRVAGAELAAAAGAEVVILDDGFQHRRLRRDLDIVAVDATDPFGCGHLFPRGLLREPIRGIRRAGVVVLTRSTSVDSERRAAIRAAVTAACGVGRTVAWVEAEHRPLALRHADGATEPLDILAGRRIAAFAGIGNPAAFRATLQSLGSQIASFDGFPDHHRYAAPDLDRLAARLPSDASLAVTTLKDLVKIGRPRLGGLPLLALEIALTPLTGGERLAEAVDAAARRAGSVGA